MFQPVVPLSGIAGWRFLEATEASQRSAFEKSATIGRDVAYFKENIWKIGTAEALVEDRRLMRVALGAFGLDEELYKTAFLEKILAGGTDDPESLANKFVDPRYREFSRAFGFGDLLGPRTIDFGFADQITSAYKERQFEIAVGDQDETMRLALTFRRQIADYAAGTNSETTQWFRILGDRPMRTVIEAAFNLPSEFAGLDLDRQVDTLKDRARSLLGSESVAVFQDPAAVEKVIGRFLLRKQMEQGPGPMVPGAAALNLLSQAARPSGITNLILSGL